jgi:hypothetical protein
MTHDLRNDVRPLETLTRLGMKEYRAWRPINTMRPSKMIGTEQYGHADLGFCKAVSARRGVIGDLAMQRITGVITTSLPETDGVVLSQSVLEFVWRGLRLDKDIRSGSEVNRLVSELLG